MRKKKEFLSTIPMNDQMIEPLFSNDIFDIFKRGTSAQICYLLKVTHFDTTLLSILFTVYGR